MELGLSAVCGYKMLLKVDWLSGLEKQLQDCCHIRCAAWVSLNINHHSTKFQLLDSVSVFIHGPKSEGDNS